MHDKIPDRLSMSLRNAIILIIFCVTLLQGGCDNQSQSSTSPMLTIPIPNQIRALKSDASSDNQLTINSRNLIIEVIIDKGTSQQQTVQLAKLSVNNTDKTVSGEISGLSPGQHQLELNYFLQRDNTKIPLVVTQTLAVNVTANQTEIASFSEDSLIYPDNDEDGYSNLAEVLNASDWQTPQSIPIPTAPRNVIATPLNRNVHLTWNAVPGAKVYTIYMAEDSTLTPNNYTELTSGMRHPDIPQAKFRHPAPLNNGAPYYFLVTASNEAGESSVSEKITATPQLSQPKVPQNFNGTGISENVELTWEPVADTEFYFIYMAEDASVTAENFDTLTSGMRHRVEKATTFTHPVPLTPNAKYSFIIIANNTAGSSARSERIEVIPRQPPTTMPNLLGKTSLEVTRLLKDSNLTLHQKTYQPKVTEPPVTVIFQSLNSDTIIDEGTAINIDVSLPPDPDGFLTDPFDEPGSQAHAAAYYQAIDPDNSRTTFEDWRQANGFTDQKNYDASVLYFNTLDHLFARKVSFRREGNNIMMYAHHYPTLADAKANTDLLETVAIEYSPAANGASAEQSYVKFFAYGPDGQRVIQTDIDAFDADLKRVAAGARNRDTRRRGAEFVPNGCIVCHGGKALALKDNIYPDQGNTQSRLIPFDMDTFEHDEAVNTQYSKTAQQESFRILNQAVIDTFVGNSGSTIATVDFEDSIAIPDFCSDSDKTGAPDCINNQPGIATLPLTVQGLTAPIQDLNITIEQLQHENISDLRLVLESPSGKQVLLIKQRGGATLNISDLQLNDEASKRIASANNTQNAPLTGIWKPEDTSDDPDISTHLATFNQENPNGIWKLIIADQKTLQAGTIHQWSLHFTLPHENTHVIQLVQGWYGNSSPLAGTFNGAFIPRGWQPPYAPDNADALYQDVIRKSCQICHLQRADDGTGRGFSSFDEFLSWAPRIERLVFREGIMPRALPTFFNFWTSNRPHQATLLASFLDNVDGSKGPRPTAHPGPNRTLKLGQTLVISGSKSILAESYQWQITSAPANSGNTEFADPTQQRQSFIPDALGDYDIELTIENRDKITDKAALTVSVVEHISFADHVLPIFQTQCKTCHALGKKPAETTGFDSTRPDKEIYELLLNIPSKLYPNQTRINLADAEASLLLLKLSNQHDDRHGGGRRPGFEPGNVNNNYFYTTLKTWIEEGALFN